MLVKVRLNGVELFQGIVQRLDPVGLQGVGLVAHLAVDGLQGACLAEGLLQVGLHIRVAGLAHLPLSLGQVLLHQLVRALLGAVLRLGLRLCQDGIRSGLGALVDAFRFQLRLIFQALCFLLRVFHDLRCLGLGLLEQAFRLFLVGHGGDRYLLGLLGGLGFC